MTVTDVIYQRRVAAVAHATEIDNIAQAARVFGIARQTLSGWMGLARQRGLSALWPKTRRPGTQPNAMADWEIEIILAEAIARPTLGAGRLLEHLADRDVHRSRTGVQKVLNRHGLGTRTARVGALAALTTATTGQVTRDTDPGGFCLWAASAGDLVGLDAFYVGKLKGIGPVWQLTGCDTRTRWTVAELIIGRPNSQVAATFLDLLADRLETVGIILSGVVVDGGPEWKATFRTRARTRGIDVHQTPPRSPNHNGITRGRRSATQCRDGVPRLPDPPLEHHRVRRLGGCPHRHGGLGAQPSSSSRSVTGPRLAPDRRADLSD